MGLGTGLAGSDYVPVTFRGSAKSPGAAHESLLKATMPVDTDHSIRPASAAAVKHRRAVAAPALRRSREDRAAVQQTVRRWVVLTSWDGPDVPERQGVVLSGSLPEIQERGTQERGLQRRVISISYAALPTAGGWLVIQL